MKAILEAFLASPDFKAGVIASSKAAYSGSGYAVELFPDGHWRLLWDEQIGNLYQSPGWIVGLPAIDAAEDDLASEFDVAADELAAQVREQCADALAWEALHA